MSGSTKKTDKSETTAPIVAHQLTTPAGGGPFSLPTFSVGVFLTDQPEHNISIGSDRVEHKPLKRNEGFILPAGASGICSYTQDHSYLAVQFDEILLREVGLDDPGRIAPQLGAFDPLTLQMAKSMIELAAAPSALYRETMYRALAAHLVQSVQTMPSDVAALDDARLRRAVAYIHDHLAGDISLEVLASEAAVSPFHFARAFKTALGASPLQYVIAERMKLAGVLLKTTTLPVSEVALRVGYEDTSRFSKHFKRAFAQTPAQHRAAD
ncbi:MAG: AraC family transcriptional regulator [Pseudomonadota bacterium]